jgi:hypothetical protein
VLVPPVTGDAEQKGREVVGGGFFFKGSHNSSQLFHPSCFVLNCFGVRIIFYIWVDYFSSFLILKTFFKYCRFVYLL